MFGYKSILTLAALFTSLSTYSQPIRKDFDYSRVDSIARRIKYKNDIYKLTKELTDPFSEPRFKVRSIFIWITDNIRYDYKFYNKGAEPKMPKCKPGENCETVLINWEKKYLDKVIRKGRAVCDGYSKLIKKMCDIAGIQSEIITGYSKTKPYQIGNTGAVNHAWNAVWLDSAYYLLDATWAAGYCVESEETGILIAFVKDYNDYYWCTPFHDFTRNHYPKDGKWIMEPNYTKEKFAANPYYASDIIDKINLLTPQSGVINAKKGDTIHFKFDYSGYFKLLQVNSNVFHNPEIWTEEKISKHRKHWVQDSFALKKQRYILFKREANQYEFDYLVTDDVLYYMDILFDHRQVMRFKVNIAKQNM